LTLKRLYTAICSLDLELAGERRFRDGVVHLHSRVNPEAT
jgi:hypothetical protein